MSNRHRKVVADTLTKLGAPEPGKAPNIDAADLVDPRLAGKEAGGTPIGFVKNGYRFTFVPQGEFGSVQHYSIRADPERAEPGQFSYFTDESGVVRANKTQPATAKDNPI